MGVKRSQQRGDRSEFNPDPEQPNSIEIIIRQGHCIGRIGRVKADISDMGLWGTEFDSLMAEMGLEARRQLGKKA